MTHQAMIRFVVPAWLARGAGAMLLALAAGSALAQGNAIESITANQQGSNVVINVAMRAAPAKAPIGFSITNPARIALDFGATANATGKSAQEINLGDVRGVNVVQAGERTRLVLNLARPLNYATAVDGKSVIVTVEGSGGVAQAVNAAGLPAAAPAPAAASRAMLRNLDVRRGANGEGRVVVDLPHSQVAVDVRQAGNQIHVDFLRSGLPETLRRRLDVTDFGTPVSRVTTTTQGENVRMTIDAQGNWEQSVYQSDTQLVVDVRPIKEDPNRVGPGPQGYRGEKLSFNFQSVEVRAALQAIADISGLNIITSDSVTGNLTLRLRDVPWDQALDVVLDVDVNKDSKGEETRAGFAINTQHVKTKVMVENGGTVVLGGIYQQAERNSESKVPVLGDVPVLGHLFKTTGRENTKTELLVFITPKIVTERSSNLR